MPDLSFQPQKWREERVVESDERASRVAPRFLFGLMTEEELREQEERERELQRDEQRRRRSRANSRASSRPPTRPHSRQPSVHTLSSDDSSDT